MIGTLFMLLCAANPPTPQDIFEAGVRAELEGQGVEARAHWEKVAQTGLRNADVEFNLGTSYAEAGELGPAVLHLRRAALLRPAPDTSSNLQAVRERLLQQNPGKTHESSLLSDLAARLVRAPLEPLLGAALVLLSLFAFLRYGPWPLYRSVIAIGLWASFVLALVSGVLLGLRALALDGRPAVVVMKRTPAKNGPDERFKNLAELVPGEELTLLPSKDASLGFLAVQLSNGETAYVADGSVTKVKDW